MMVKVKEEVTKKVTRNEVVSEAVYMTKCDSCGKLYHPKNDELTIQFTRCRVNDGGNLDTWKVCSFECATNIVNGGWRDTENGKGFKSYKSKIHVARASYTYTPTYYYQESE